MNEEMLAIINKKEGRNCEGKTVSSFEGDNNYCLITFNDGSTLRIESGIFKHQVLFLNKQGV